MVKIYYGYSSAASGRDCNGRGKSILGFGVAVLSESLQYNSSAGVSFFPYHFDKEVVKNKIRKNTRRYKSLRYNQ